jgi:hypothetical protein
MVFKQRVSYATAPFIGDYPSTCFLGDASVPSNSFYKENSETIF